MIPIQNMSILSLSEFFGLFFNSTMKNKPLTAPVNMNDLSSTSLKLKIACYIIVKSCSEHNAAFLTKCRYA